MNNYPYASTLIMSLSGQQGRAYATAASNLLPLFTGHNSYTLQAWVRFGDLTGDQVIVAASGASSTAPLLALQDGCFLGSRSIDATLTSTTRPEQGQWNHIALAYDGESHLLNLYINGFLEAATHDYASADSAAQALLIGGQMNAGAAVPSLNGSVRSVAVWSVYRTQDEIWQDINSPPQPQEGLQAWYGFEQNPVADVSGHACQISITGALSPQVETTCLQALGDGYGDCGPSDNLNFVGQQPFTLEALVNLNQITMQDFISRYHQGVGQYSLGTGSETDHSLGSATTRYFNSYCSNPSVWWIFSTTAPQAQQWYHVATTYDGQTLSLYVDGQLQRSASWGGPNPDPHNNTLIGARFTSDGTPQIQFNGRLAYARMWNVCRTAEEIQESINTNPLNAEGLAANFDFGSMTDAPEPSAQEVPRQDLTYQNAVTLKGNAAITTFIQPITLESAQQVPPTPDTDQFTTYEAPEITPELRANFSKLASSISPKAFGDPLSDANLKAFLDEYNGALPANISAEQRQQMQAAYQQKITDLFEKARQGGLDGIRGDRYVKWVSEGDQQVLRYYEPGASHEVLRVASRDATPQEMWLLEFLATLIIGFLAVLGIYVNGGAIAKLGAFLLKESKVVTRIVAIISTGAAITATSILEVVDYLFVSGYLKKIIMIVAKLSFWTLSAFLLSLAVTIFAPEARVPQMLAAFALLAVHLVVLALEYPTDNKATALN